MTPENARLLTRDLISRQIPLYELLAPVFLDASWEDASEALDALCRVAHKKGTPVYGLRNARARAIVYTLNNPEDKVTGLSAAAVRYSNMHPDRCPGGTGVLPNPPPLVAFRAMYDTTTGYGKPPVGKYTLVDGSRLAVTELGCAVQRPISDAEAGRLHATRLSHLSLVGG